VLENSKTGLAQEDCAMTVIAHKGYLLIPLTFVFNKFKTVGILLGEGRKRT